MSNVNHMVCDTVWGEDNGWDDRMSALEGFVVGSSVWGLANTGLTRIVRTRAIALDIARLTRSAAITPCIKSSALGSLCAFTE
jgi:hypothetical protein